MGLFNWDSLIGLLCTRLIVLRIKMALKVVKRLGLSETRVEVVTDWQIFVVVLPKHNILSTSWVAALVYIRTGIVARTNTSLFNVTASNPVRFPRRVSLCLITFVYLGLRFVLVRLEGGFWVKSIVGWLGLHNCIPLSASCSGSCCVAAISKLIISSYLRFLKLFSR